MSDHQLQLGLQRLNSLAEAMADLSSSLSDSTGKKVDIKGVKASVDDLQSRMAVIEKALGIK